MNPTIEPATPPSLEQRVQPPADETLDARRRLADSLRARRLPDGSVRMQLPIDGHGDATTVVLASNAQIARALAVGPLAPRTAHSSQASPIEPNRLSRDGSRKKPG